MTVNVFDLTDTWDNAGTTFYAIKMNVNFTAATSMSRLLDLRTNGALQFSVSHQNGVIVGSPTGMTMGQGTVNAVNYFVNGQTLQASLSGAFQPLDADLTALAGAAVTGTFYYRKAPGDWQPVIISTGLIFDPITGSLQSTGGGGGGGNVNSSGTPVSGQLSLWVSAAAIKGINIGTGLQLVTVGPDQVLEATGAGGNVSNVGTPTNGQLAQWTDTTHIQGVAAASLGFAPIASPVFTGDPQAPTPLTTDNDTSIATTAFVKAVVAGAGSATSISDTPPASPTNGQMWWESDTGALWISYSDDGGLTRQWVQANGNQNGQDNGLTIVKRQYLSGSGTHTTTPNTLFMDVQLVGAGSGGSGGASATPSGAGGTTTFGPLSATGGAGSVASVSGAAGVGSGGDVNLRGGAGGTSTASLAGAIHGFGGEGGASFYGGGGAGRYSPTIAGFPGEAPGSGGGGGGVDAAATGSQGGVGGAAGGYCRALLGSPAASYAYSVGAGGTAGPAGPSGVPGGAGAPGLIQVTEYVGKQTLLGGNVNAVGVPSAGQAAVWTSGNAIQGVSDVGRKVLIQSQTVSAAVAAVNFTSGIDATYDEYELVFYNARPVVDGDFFLLQISMDGGATWKTDVGYHYSGRTVGAVGAASDAQGAPSNGVLMSNGTFAASAGTVPANGTVKFWSPSAPASAGLHVFQVDSMSHNSFFGICRFTGSGAYVTTQGSFNGLRVAASGGNTASGTFKLYGIKK